MLGPQILSPEISCRLTIAFASLVSFTPKAGVPELFLVAGVGECLVYSWLPRIRSVKSRASLRTGYVSLAEVIAFNISVRWHQRTYHESNVASEPRRCRRSLLKASVVSIVHLEICFVASVCTGRSWTQHNRYRDTATIRSCARDSVCLPPGGARIHDSRR